MSSVIRRYSVPKIGLKATLLASVIGVGCERQEERSASEAPVSPPASLTEKPGGVVVGSSGNDQSSPARQPSRTDGAMMYIAEPVVDFGAIADYETKKAVVKFVNRGDQTLEITRVQPTCGCTTTELEQKLFAPGEGSEIELTFNPKGSGRQTKIVKVYTNDSVKPVQTISIKAEVSASVTTNPKSLSIGTLRMGEMGTASVILTAENPTYVPTSNRILGALKDYATAEIIPVANAGARKKSWRVEVRISPDIPWGWYTGSLQISGTLNDPKTGNSRGKSIVVGMNAGVQGDITASDTIFRLMILNTNEDFEKRLTLRREGGRPFTILSAEVSNGRPDSMAVAVVPVEGSNGSAYELVLTGNTGTVPTSILGQVDLVTDVPGEEQITVRIAGSIRNR